jgi:MoxR-like ATPase
MSTRDQILQLKQRMGQSIIGQEQVIGRLLLALLANGNLLLEGLPGLAKTRAVKRLARNLESEFRRIPFTPDLLPSDVTGTEVYYEGGKGSFRFQPGPIFGNLVLADEINRAPAKVQAALLEAMEERQVTVVGKTHKLPELFRVLATQNPIEQEGTYPLPEAQRERFLLHIMVRYPSDPDELEVMRLVRGEETQQVWGAAKAEVIAQQVVFDARAEIHQVAVAEAVERYIVAFIAATR